MDSERPGDNESLTSLTTCVNDEMSAREAACATEDCWTQAEEAITPVIGQEGVGVLLRKGEEIAVRNVGPEVPPAPGASKPAFFAWIGTLAKSDALAACKAFLETVERYLVSLVGIDRARRMLERRR
jgi:hypothetical protein